VGKECAVPGITMARAGAASWALCIRIAKSGLEVSSENNKVSVKHMVLLDEYSRFKLTLSRLKSTTGSFMHVNTIFLHLIKGERSFETLLSPIYTVKADFFLLMYCNETHVTQ
jgi:hypothetical protein